MVGVGEEASFSRFCGHAPLVLSLCALVWLKTASKPKSQILKSEIYRL
jgi:hypothetical protein